MNQKTDLTLAQKLGQRLSPQQVRFVRLLEMNGPELEDEVRRELDDNPALDTEENDVLRAGSSESADTESAVEMQIADYRGDDIPPYLLRVSNRGADDDRQHRDRRDDAPGLVESLNAQIDMVEAPPHTIALARYLVGNLDSNGRLARNLSDITADIEIATGLHVSRDQLVSALDIIRYQLDPPGVGAVDLRECLILQLRRKPMTLERRAALEIVSDHFDLFSKKHFDRIRGILGIDRDLFDRAVSEIVSLNPKPGGSADSAGDAAVPITPDFIVTPVEDFPGRFSVSLNQHVPSMTIEESFTVDPENSEARIFVRRKRSEATTFISLVNRRSQTLVAVMKAIVAIQYDFFESGNPADIRPMILKDLAEATGYDISVISRATSNKYVATETGIFPLKMFFNDNPFDNDEATSARILEVLKSVIGSEDKRHPLSDRAITDEMNRRGYALARRTVAKYRERLNIPVARLRKVT